MKKLSTQPYKGVRDFYPEDMSVQQYIFDTWSYSASQFGFQRYDASVLEPAELYRAKGAENEELANEQTYTFKDRGNREVTLRPEMTPTVARMIAGRSRELTFPVRWYSIPNLFRYERTQRGRLREHWQLNCDIFGNDSVDADVEILLLANSIFENFGAENGTHYRIDVSSRAVLEAFYTELALSPRARLAITRLADRKLKMPEKEFKAALAQIAEGKEDAVLAFLNAERLGEVPVEAQKSEAFLRLKATIDTLEKLKVAAHFNPTVIRGFDYYTGLVFEVVDLHEDNNRAMMGGGRYDNLTALFSSEAVSGIGFGMGDVTMRDFLESHNLLTSDIQAPTLTIVPVSEAETALAQELALTCRRAGIATSVDYSDRKLGKKISNADAQFIEYVIIIGAEEAAAGTYELKHLATKESTTGSIEAHIDHIIERM